MSLPAQPLYRLLVMGGMLCNKGPESGRVIEVFQVTEFMDNDVSQYGGGEQNEAPVEREAASLGTASPFGLLIADCNAAVPYSDTLGLPAGNTIDDGHGMVHQPVAQSVPEKPAAGAWDQGVNLVLHKSETWFPECQADAQLPDTPANRNQGAVSQGWLRRRRGNADEVAYHPVATFP